jgi:hypothetical protein
MEPRAVSISDIAQETGSDVGQREELLTIVSGMFACPEELLVYLRIVESG